MHLALELMMEPPMGKGLTLATHLPCRNKFCYAGKLEGREYANGTFVQHRGEDCHDCIGLDVLGLGGHRDRVAALWVCDHGHCGESVNDTEAALPNMNWLVDAGWTVCDDCAKLCRETED